MKSIIYAIFIIFIVSLLSCSQNKKNIRIHVFYKNRTPSLKVLDAVKELLDGYNDNYEIIFLDIEDELNFDLISKFNLPETHLPFAVVIDGKYTAINKDKELISFVHFPLFMKGIGRHEGNWSLDDLSNALNDNTLLLEQNILPELNEDEETTQCEDE